MTLYNDIKRMGDLCRSCGDGGTRTIYSAGVELMRLFLEREEELLSMTKEQSAEDEVAGMFRDLAHDLHMSRSTRENP